MTQLQTQCPWWWWWWIVSWSLQLQQHRNGIKRPPLKHYRIEWSSAINNRALKLNVTLVAHGFPKARCRESDWCQQVFQKRQLLPIHGLPHPGNPRISAYRILARHSERFSHSVWTTTICKFFKTHQANGIRFNVFFFSADWFGSNKYRSAGTDKDPLTFAERWGLSEGPFAQIFARWK